MFFLKGISFCIGAIFAASPFWIPSMSVDAASLGSQILSALNNMEKVAVDKMKKAHLIVADAPGKATVTTVSRPKNVSVVKAKQNSSSSSSDELIDKIGRVIETPEFKTQLKTLLGSLVKGLDLHDDAAVAATPSANIISVNKLGDDKGAKPDAVIVTPKKTPGADRKYSTEDYMEPSPQKEIEVTSFQKITKQKLKPKAVTTDKPAKAVIVAKNEDPALVLASKPANTVRVSRSRRNGSTLGGKRKTVKKIESPGPDNVKRIIISTNKSTPVQDNASADGNTEGILRELMKKISKPADETEDATEPALTPANVHPESAISIVPIAATASSPVKAPLAAAPAPKALPVDRPAMTPPTSIQNDEEPIVSGNHGGLVERLKKIAKLVPELLNDAAKNGANPATEVESAQYKPRVIRLQPTDEE